MAKLWEKPAHTEMKHRLLRRYLQAWLPILGKWHVKIAVVDGFAARHAAEEPGRGTTAQAHFRGDQGAGAQERGAIALLCGDG